MHKVLRSQNDLIILVGRPTATLRSLPNTILVQSVGDLSSSSVESPSPLLEFGVLAGVSLLLFPIAALIVTATRIGAARREERFAALRLVGATMHQIAAIASVETGVGALGGVFVGSALFWLLRPLFATWSILSGPFFVQDFQPGALAYGLLVIGTPVFAIVAALMSLRRVKLSPLGVSHKATPSEPKAWGFGVLTLSFAVFISLLLKIHSESSSSVSKSVTLALVACLLVTMISLIISGPWLTMMAAKLLTRYAKHASTLLAGRRLLDNPKAAFRTVLGLVVIVFSAALLGCSARFYGSDYGPSTPVSHTLQNTMFVPLTSYNFLDANPNVISNTQPITTAASKTLLQALHRQTHAIAVPVYSNYLDPNVGQDNSPNQAIMLCSDVMHLPAPLQHCAPGGVAMYADTSGVSNFFFSGGGIPIQSTLLTAPAPGTSAQLQSAGALDGIFLITNGSPQAIEEIRTILTDYASNVPVTFSRSQADNKTAFNTLIHILYAGVGIMIFVAACNLVVALIGSLIERKMPFTLLRTAGTPLAVIYKLILIEAFIPLISGIVFALGSALGMAYIFFTLIHKKGMPTFQLPSLAFWLTLGAGIFGALLIIVSVLPLIGRTTKPEHVRFE